MTKYFSILAACAAIAISSALHAQTFERPFGMHSGIVRENLTVGGSVGTSSLTINDSSTVDQGVTMGVGCPDPNDPNCFDGLLVTGGTGGNLGVRMLSLSRQGDLRVPGGITLGGAFNLGPNGSFGTQGAPIPMVFTSNLSTGGLELEDDGGFQTRMLSGDVGMDQQLMLPANDPVPGATLFVSSVSYNQNQSEVASTLDWVRVTDRADAVTIPTLLPNESGYAYISLSTIPSEGTATVSPIDGLPDGLIIAYAFTNSDGNVTVVLRNVSVDPIQSYDQSFFVTVMPYIH